MVARSSRAEATVLLDAGGVILDESEHEAVRAELAVALLREVVPGYTRDTYQADVEEAVYRFCPLVYEYVFWKRLGRNPGEFHQQYTAYQRAWETRKPPLKLMAGIEEEVRAMADEFNLGIAGQYGGEILDLLEHADVLDCFIFRLTQDDFALTKPDPRYFEQIVRAFGVAPETCVMVGDRIDKDVIPAKQLGMKTIRIRTGLHRNQQPRIPFEIPDTELDGMLGLAAAVRKVVNGTWMSD